MVEMYDGKHVKIFASHGQSKLVVPQVWVITDAPELHDGVVDTFHTSTITAILTSSELLLHDVTQRLLIGSEWTAQHMLGLHGAQQVV